MMFPRRGFLFFLPAALLAAAHPLVLQTDFGLKDGAVAAMRRQSIVFLADGLD